ncbi:fructose-bisphosphatase class II, partial [Klebsiella pneumoniae]
MPHPVVPKRAGATPHTSIIPTFPCATLRAIPYGLELSIGR